MIDYRPALPSDLPQVAALLLEMMHEHGVSGPDAAELQAVLAPMLSARDQLLLVADIDGRAVGTCSLHFTLNTWAAAPSSELQDIVVTGDLRGTDIGRGLVEAASAEALKRGCTRLFLLAEAWNLDAHAFYRSLGLEEKTCLYFERDLRDRSA